jgi:hypothetical protein
MDKPPKYVTSVTRVREVSLRGSADLGYWTDRLREERLTPMDRDGDAEILIVAAAMKFLGIRFTEVSFSVSVTESAADPPRDAALLGQAFSTSRLLASCERVFFAAPYAHAHCRLSVSLPVSIHVDRNGDAIFQAEMGASSSAGERQPSRTADDRWSGAIHLPRTRIGRGSLFFARLEGLTREYPILPDDTVRFGAYRGIGILEDLVASRFAAQTWIVREDATHARSKTFTSRGPTR